MKGSWKLCVISGSLMVFAVLGALVFLGHSVSLADSEEKEFIIEQGLTGEDGAAGKVTGAGMEAELAQYARHFVGIRYVYGGTKLPDIESVTYTDSVKGGIDTEQLEQTNKRIWGDEYGVDSSGFVMKVFAHFGIKLPRTCVEQADGKDILIKVKDVQPGDILFYGAGADKITHCGIYVGDGQVIHASSQKKMVTLSDMNYRRIVKVKRVIKD